MTEFTQLVAISGVCLTYYFALMYGTKLTNDLADQIKTGFIRDHPISIEERWFMLYSRWIAYVMPMVAVPFLLALAAAMMANHAGGADSRLLGYAAAFLLAIAGSTWLIMGSLQFWNYRRLLRQAEAD